MTFYNELRGAAHQERGTHVLAQTLKDLDIRAAQVLGPEYGAAHEAVHGLIESRATIMSASANDFTSARDAIADAIVASIDDLDPDTGIRKGMTSVAAKLRDPAQRLEDLRKLTPHMIRWHKPERPLAGHLAGIGKLTILLAAAEERAGLN